MADISMCMNKTCPIRTTCYRFLAPANDLRQSYCDFRCIHSKYGAVCDNYWKTEEKEESID